MSYNRGMCVCVRHREQVPAAAVVLWDFDRYLGEQLQAGQLTEAEARALRRARDRLHRLVIDANGAELAA